MNPINDLPSALRAVMARRDLAREEMTLVMERVMGGHATSAQIGGFLVALAMKGETIDEIAAAAQVMRRLATPVTVVGDHVLDTCGTGGDGSHLFNVSTASALVAAAAGAQVAKHGNRAASGKSGSADVLELAGVKLDLSPAQISQCIQQVGVGFIFAPAHHSAMKHAIGPRREMGIRTMFNLLGPLTNPAGAPHQVLGVFDRKWLIPLAEVLRALGSRHVLIVHSRDGLDEISLAAPTEIAELKNGDIDHYELSPDAVGMARQSLDAARVASPAESLALIQAALRNEEGAARDLVVLNAGAAIYAADVAASWADGVAIAREVLASGAAAAKLAALIAFTQGVARD